MDIIEDFKNVLYDVCVKNNRPFPDVNINIENGSYKLLLGKEPILIEQTKEELESGIVSLTNFLKE